MGQRREEYKAADHGQWRRINLPDPEASQAGSAGSFPARTDGIGAILLRMMDNLGICPAYVLDRCFISVPAWNHAAAAVFGDFSQTSGRDCNQVWAMFTKPGYRQRHVNWEYQARLTLAQFRTLYGHNLGNKELAKFVQELMEVSAEFKTWWQDCDIFGRNEGRVEVTHSVAGSLKLDHISLEVPGYAGLTLRVYTPVPGTATAEKIKLLLETPGFASLRRKDTCANGIA